MGSGSGGRRPPPENRSALGAQVEVQETNRNSRPLRIPIYLFECFEPESRYPPEVAQQIPGDDKLVFIVIDHQHVNGLVSFCVHVILSPMRSRFCALDKNS